MEFEINEENLTLEKLKQFFKKELLEYQHWSFTLPDSFFIIKNLHHQS